MSPFKVLIVGGGPAGCTLAHCLGLAGIDYLLFERRKTLIDHGGSTIFLTPDGSRVLYQIGLLDSARELSERQESVIEYGWDGELVRTTKTFVQTEENHGYPTLLFSRPTLLKVLSQTLPESKVRVGAELDTIAMTDTGVEVHLKDGSSERGSIIVGADGVYSPLRRLLVQQDPAALGGQGSFTQHDFKILYGRSAPSPLLQKTVGNFLIRHGKGWFFQMGCGNGEAYWALYEAQQGPAEPTSGRKGFTVEETEAFAEGYRDVVFVAEMGLTLGHVWDERSVGFLDWMDEGIAESWFHDRAVFVGDAAAKTNPSRAQGANAAMESAVTLTNELQAMLKKNHQGDEEPSTTDLAQAFQRYQSLREDKMKAYVHGSMRYARVECWSDWRDRAFWKIIGLLVNVQATFLADVLIAPWMRKSSRLDCVGDKEGMDLKGRIPWTDLRVSRKLEGTIWTGLGMAFWALMGWRPVWQVGS